MSMSYDSELPCVQKQRDNNVKKLIARYSSSIEEKHDGNVGDNKISRNYVPNRQRQTSCNNETQVRRKKSRRNSRRSRRRRSDARKQNQSFFCKENEYDKNVMTKMRNIDAPFPRNNTSENGFNVRNHNISNYRHRVETFEEDNGSQLNLPQKNHFESQQNFHQQRSPNVNQIFEEKIRDQHNVSSTILDTSINKTRNTSNNINLEVDSQTFPQNTYSSKRIMDNDKKTKRRMKMPTPPPPPPSFSQNHKKLISIKTKIVHGIPKCALGVKVLSQIKSKCWKLKQVNQKRIGADLNRFVKSTIKKTAFLFNDNVQSNRSVHNGENQVKTMSNKKDSSRFYQKEICDKSVVSMERKSIHDANLSIPKSEHIIEARTNSSDNTDESLVTVQKSSLSSHVLDDIRLQRKMKCVIQTEDQSTQPTTKSPKRIEALRLPTKPNTRGLNEPVPEKERSSIDKKDVATTIRKPDQPNRKKLTEHLHFLSSISPKNPKNMDATRNLEEKIGHKYGQADVSTHHLDESGEKARNKKMEKLSEICTDDNTTSKPNDTTHIFDANSTCNESPTAASQNYSQTNNHSGKSKKKFRWFSRKKCNNYTYEKGATKPRDKEDRNNNGISTKASKCKKMEPTLKVKNSPTKALFMNNVREKPPPPPPRRKLAPMQSCLQERGGEMTHTLIPEKGQYEQTQRKNISQQNDDISTSTTKEVEKSEIVSSDENSSFSSTSTPKEVHEPSGLNISHACEQNSDLSSASIDMNDTLPSTIKTSSNKHDILRTVRENTERQIKYPTPPNQGTNVPSKSSSSLGRLVLSDIRSGDAKLKPPKQSSSNNSNFSVNKFGNTKDNEGGSGTKVLSLMDQIKLKKELKKVDKAVAHPSRVSNSKEKKPTLLDQIKSGGTTLKKVDAIQSSEILQNANSKESSNNGMFTGGENMNNLLARRRFLHQQTTQDNESSDSDDDDWT